MVTASTDKSDLYNISSLIYLLTAKCMCVFSASDGQHVYLHAVNAQMLEMAHGSLRNGPRVLTGRIVEKEAGSMTPELRRRLRYLQHLPVTAQFEVVEVELFPPTISEDTLYAFKGDFIEPLMLT